MQLHIGGREEAEVRSWNQMWRRRRRRVSGFTLVLGLRGRQQQSQEGSRSQRQTALHLHLLWLSSTCIKLQEETEEAVKSSSSDHVALQQPSQHLLLPGGELHRLKSSAQCKAAIIYIYTSSLVTKTLTEKTASVSLVGNNTGNKDE